jgi:hypothetical protein
MASEQVRRQLYEAVAAHRADLEIERGFAGLELEVLDRRIEASQRLLEWLEQTPELPSEVSAGLKRLSRPRNRASADVIFADFLSRSVGGSLATVRGQEAARRESESKSA